MAKYLRDLAFYVPPSEMGPDEKLFALSTHFLKVLYLDCLPRVATDGVPKVVIRPRRIVPENPLKVMLRHPTILEISKPFDFSAYAKADKQARKRIALHLLQETLLEVAAGRGWDAKPFDEAYDKVLKRELINWRSWGKPVTSASRKYKAQVWCNYDSDKADIFIVVFHRKAMVKKALVTTVQPGNVWINDAVGKLEWLSESRLGLTSRDGKQAWEIEASTPEPKP